MLDYVLDYARCGFTGFSVGDILTEGFKGSWGDAVSVGVATPEIGILMLATGGDTWLSRRE